MSSTLIASNAFSTRFSNKETFHDQQNSKKKKNWNIINPSNGKDNASLLSESA